MESKLPRRETHDQFACSRRAEKKTTLEKTSSINHIIGNRDHAEKMNYMIDGKQAACYTRIKRIEQ